MRGLWLGGVGGRTTGEGVDWSTAFSLGDSTEDILGGCDLFVLALLLEDSFLLSIPHLALIVSLLSQLLLPD